MLTRLMQGVKKMELALDAYLLGKWTLSRIAKTVGQRIIEAINAASEKNYQSWLKNNRPGYWQ